MQNLEIVATARHHLLHILSCFALLNLSVVCL